MLMQFCYFINKYTKVGIAKFCTVPYPIYIIINFTFCREAFMYKYYLQSFLEIDFLNWYELDNIFCYSTDL